MAPPIYDAVVVGSGATGGWVAKELTAAGLTVAVLEAGRQARPRRGLHRAQAALRHAVPRPASRPPRARGRAGGAGEVLPVRRVHEPPVREGHRVPLHDAEGQALRVDPRAARRRQVHHLGTPELPPVRLRLESRQPRRLRRGLAARLRGARALLRPGRAVHRRLRGRRRACRSSPTASSSRPWP